MLLHPLQRARLVLQTQEADVQPVLVVSDLGPHEHAGEHPARLALVCRVVSSRGVKDDDIQSTSHLTLVRASHSITSVTCSTQRVCSSFTYSSQGSGYRRGQRHGATTWEQVKKARLLPLPPPLLLLLVLGCCTQKAVPRQSIS